MVDTVLLLVSSSCYPERIAPAAERFAKSGNPIEIVALLRQAQARLRTVPAAQNPLRFRDHDLLQGHLNILEGREYYDPPDHRRPSPGARTSAANMRRYVTEQVYDSLFVGSCAVLENGLLPELTLTRGGLLPYLYRHSTVLVEAFTGGLSGQALPLFPHMELLDRKDVARILAELEKVPIPNDAEEKRKAEAELAALRRGGRQVFVSSEIAGLLHEKPVSQQIKEMKALLRRALANPAYAVIQAFE